MRKIDLLIVNGMHPVVMVSGRGLSVYTGEVPYKKSDAKKAYVEVIEVNGIDCFGEEKTLIFVQALNNKEYKIDYSKTDTENFIKIHQENYT